MSVQDRISTKNTLLAISDRDLTAAEQLQIQQGVQIERLVEAMSAFKQLLVDYSDAAVDLVNDFKSSEAYIQLMEAME